MLQSLNLLKPLIKDMGSQEEDDFLSAFGMTRMIGVQLALRAAVELNVFTIIANSGPQALLTVEEIIAKIPTKNPNAATALEKILNVLGSHSFLSASPTTSLSGGKRPEKAYGLTKQSRCLAANDRGVSLASVLLFGSDREIVDSFFTLKDAVLEASYKGTYDKASGETFFESLKKKPGLNKVFHDMMSVCSKVMFEQVLRVYRGFEEVKELMDVGGGNGTALEMIISAHPHIHGINVDLPHVIADAPNIAGVKHVAGDMFESLPNAETILLKWILHDWDEDRSIKILRNCWKALPENGKVIVVEFLVSQEFTETGHTTFMDLMMMALNLGGKERTTSEFDLLAKAAGFAQTITFPTHNQGFDVMEFIKKT